MSALLRPVPESLEIVPMRREDIDAVVAVENTVYPFPWSWGNFYDSMQAGYSAWTCRAGGALAGYTVFMVAVDEAHLLNISVAQPYQGRGLGARLLRHAMDAAWRAGARSMLLEVRPSNLPALRLYRHFGFEQIGLRRGYYPAENGREDALVFHRVLGETCA